MSTKVFSGWFQQIRTKKQLTQTEAAAELKLSGPTISRWENGSALPRVEHLPRLMKWAKISADKLIALFT